MIRKKALQRWVDSIVLVILAGIFVYSGVIKLMGPGAFYEDILGYRIIGPFVAYPVAFFLPAYELVCGVGLFFGRSRNAALMGILIMLVVFMAAILSAWVRGIDVSCGCFGGELEGNVDSYDPLMWLLRDAVMLLMVARLWCAPRRF